MEVPGGMEETKKPVSYTHLGSGAKILGSFEVGDNCSVAANAVLLRPLEENTTAVGIPARPVKTVSYTHLNPAVPRGGCWR